MLESFSNDILKGQRRQSLQMQPYFEGLQNFLLVLNISASLNQAS